MSLIYIDSSYRYFRRKWCGNPDIDAGRLIAVLPDYESVEPSGDLPSLWIMYPSKQLPYRVRLLVDHMRSAIPEARKVLYGNG